MVPLRSISRAWGLVTAVVSFSFNKSLQFSEIVVGVAAEPFFTNQLFSE
jgi:hypothetical protein